MFNEKVILKMLDEPIPNVKVIIKKYAFICIALFKNTILDEEEDVKKTRKYKYLIESIEDEYEDHPILSGYLQIKSEARKLIEHLDEDIRKSGRLIPTNGMLFKKVKFIDKKSLMNTTLIANNMKNLFIYLPAKATVLYNMPDYVKNVNYGSINPYDKNSLTVNLMKSPAEQYRNLLETIDKVLLAEQNRFIFSIPDWMNIRVIKFSNILDMKKNIIFKSVDPKATPYIQLVDYVIELYNGLLNALKLRDPIGVFNPKLTIMEQFKQSQFYVDPSGSISLAYQYGYYKKQYKIYKQKFKKLKKKMKIT